VDLLVYNQASRDIDILQTTMPIYYASVTKNGETIASFGPKKNYQSTIRNITERIPHQTHNQTLKENDNSIHYHHFKQDRDTSYLLVAVTDEKFPLRIVFDKLFKEMLNEAQQPTNKLSQYLSERAKFWNDPKNDSMTKMQNKINTIKEEMVDNVEKMMAQQEQLAVVQEKTEELNDNSEQFRKNARSLKHTQSWWEWITEIVVEAVDSIKN
jgi:vesicle-associated membrane protein 7